MDATVLWRNRAAVEGQGGVALFQETDLVEVFDLVGEGEGFAVFGDDYGVGAEELGGAEVAEDAEVVVRGGIGWVEEDTVEGGLTGVAGGQGLQAAQGVGRVDDGARADGEGFEILSDEGYGWRVILHEDNLCGATTESFYAYGTRSGEEIDEVGASDCRTEDVEEGFAEFVAGGTEGEALEGFEDAGAVLSGDNAHGGKKLAQRAVVC